MSAKPADTTPLQTRSQRYAQKAFACVQDIAKNKTLAEQYQSYARNFPTMILQCGLAQTLAFVQSKANGDGKQAPAYKQWLEHIQVVIQDESGNPKLCTEARKAELTAYMLLTYQALEAAGWLKRYAEALIVKEEDKPTPGGEHGKEVSHAQK